MIGIIESTELQELLTKLLLEYNKVFSQILGINLAIVLRKNLGKKVDIEEFLKLQKEYMDKIMKLS